MSKTVLVTGASSGIGRSTAIHFAKNGWRVAASVRSVEKCSDMQDIENLKLYKMDVTDVASIKQCVNGIIADYSQIDVLVNNAGIVQVGVFESQSTEKSREIFDTNFFGVLDVTRNILPHMREKKQGHIINVSSYTSLIPYPFVVVYAASKAALTSFTMGLRHEVSQFGIHASIVYPGTVKSNIMNNANDSNDTMPDQYKEFTQSFDQVVKDAYKNAVSPQTVADKIYEIATSENPKMRYGADTSAENVMQLAKQSDDDIEAKMKQQL